jgi:hypothetical protein
MTGLQKSILKLAVLLICMVSGITTVALARQDHQRDPLGFLKRMLTEAGAAGLTSDQETQLNALITDFRSARPAEPDGSLMAAQTAYSNAILAGDLEAAQAQAAIIASRTAELAKARLQAVTKFQIDALSVLKSGGQLDALKQKLGSEHLVRVLAMLAGGPPFGGGRFGFGPGGPGFGLRPPPEKSGKD